MSKSAGIIFPKKLRGALFMDEHQVNSIIATAIWECRKGHPDINIDPEEAKQMAKCILEALSDAALKIVRSDNG
jgi:hypothetical protein